jgi:hypothetical protein
MIPPSSVSACQLRSKEAVAPRVFCFQLENCLLLNYSRFKFLPAGFMDAQAVSEVPSLRDGRRFKEEGESMELVLVVAQLRSELADQRQRNSILEKENRQLRSDCNSQIFAALEDHTSRMRSYYEVRIRELEAQVTSLRREVDDAHAFTARTTSLVDLRLDPLDSPSPHRTQQRWHSGNDRKSPTSDLPDRGPSLQQEKPFSPDTAAMGREQSSPSERVITF